MNYYDVIFAQQKAKKDSKYFNEISNAINVLAGTETTYTPSEMAPAIIDAIPTETANGNPIHITDAAAYPVQECVTTLEPVQDLHGYDKPWSAGGGKNLFDGHIEQGGIKITDGAESPNTNRVRTDFIQIEPNTDYVFSSNLLVRGMCAYDENQEYASTLVNAASGRNPATFTTPSNAAYIRIGLMISGEADITPSDFEWGQLELGSTATSYEPYSNICPITGHTGVELTRTGKNLCSGLEQGTFRTDGTKIESLNRLRTKDMVKLIGGQTYTLKVYPLSNISGNLSYQYWGNDTFGDNTRIYDSGWTDTETLTISPTIDCYFSFVVKKSNGDYVSLSDFVAQLELGNQATTYEPYQAETHSITFPQAQSPVYGGEIDWTNGVLRVTEVNIASYNGETLPSVWISDRDVYAEGTTPSIGAQVVYKLATPIEIPLTPEVITLLKGKNNIWTDAGTSEIEYTVDLQSYIQN